MTQNTPQEPHSRAGSERPGPERSEDASFGVVPLRYRKGQWQVLLVQHRQGHWAFPKGHPNPGESTQTTACRELFEETQCRVIRFLNHPSLVEIYHFRAAHRLITKTVTYFLAEVEGDPSPQPEELRAAVWFSLREADQRATFEKCKKMIQEVGTFIGHRKPDQVDGRPEWVVASWKEPSP